MKMVGIADLKARLSEYLDLVKSGEELLITERGKPVATVNSVASRESELEELVRAGTVRPPVKPLADDFFELERPSDADGSVVDALLEERAEGR